MELSSNRSKKTYTPVSERSILDRTLLSLSDFVGLIFDIVSEFHYSAMSFGHTTSRGDSLFLVCNSI